MIIIVAPYSPPDRSKNANLGAARKIETILSILSHLDSRLVLINSAHINNNPAPISIRTTTLTRCELIEVTPNISSNRSVGKLKNVFEVKQILKVVEKIGLPQLIWFYNGYAFEMRFAVEARKRFNVPMILEFEDWHFSRNRGFNPKPFIDFVIWRIAGRYMSGAFAVNERLASKMRRFIDNVQLLPGIVPKNLADICRNVLPFRSAEGLINLGYFGGLSNEKGADIVLLLARMLPEGYVLHVTGTGPLTAEFELCAKDFSKRLRYYGSVDEMTLYQLIAKCDVILNPHSSIKSMNDGIFPFKVIEAVASGRLLISTAVSEQGLEDVLNGVQFVDHTVDAFNRAVIKSKQHYYQHESLIVQGAIVANKRFGEVTILERIQSMMG